jgi:hypothetical protein
VNEPVPDVVGDMVCSARRCTCGAQWALLWNNPSLHTPDRRKVWLCCDEHTDHLTRFLEARGFLKGVVGVDELLPVSA